jgi:hypothetical protein
MDVNEIKQNALDGLETLKYILEIKIGEGLNNISYDDVDFSISEDEGLFDVTGEITIDMMCDGDLGMISKVFKKLDVSFEDVFRSYFFTDKGKLSKIKSDTPPNNSLGLGYMLFELRPDFGDKETISIIMGINSYDYF